MRPKPQSATILLKPKNLNKNAPIPLHELIVYKSIHIGFYRVPIHIGFSSFCWLLYDLTMVVGMFQNFKISKFIWSSHNHYTKYSIGCQWLHLIFVGWWQSVNVAQNFYYMGQSVYCDHVQEAVLSAVCGHPVQSCQYTLTLFGRESWKGTEVVCFIFILGWIWLSEKCFSWSFIHQFYQQKGRFA